VQFSNSFRTLYVLFKNLIASELNFDVVADAEVPVVGEPTRGDEHEG